MGIEITLPQFGKVSGTRPGISKNTISVDLAIDAPVDRPTGNLGRKDASL